MLEGDLGDFTLPDILKLLAFTGKTGRLGIVSDGARGRVDLVKGQLRDASAHAGHLPLARRLLGRRLLDGAGLRALLGDAEVLPTDLELARRLVLRDGDAADAVGEVLKQQTLDAVFDLLRWSTGTFRFDAGTELDIGETAPVLQLSVDAALAEAERRLEAWARIRERTGPGDAVVHVGRPSETSVQVDADGWQLLGLADGIRTVDELSVLCGRGQFDTRSTLATLVELGVVTIVADGSAAGEDTLLADQALLARLESALNGTAAGTSASPELEREPVAIAPSDERVEEPSDERVESWSSDAAPLSATVHDLNPVEVAERPEGVLVGSVAGTRRAGHNGRLQQDPAVDVDLVSRLIDGVEGL